MSQIITWKKALLITLLLSSTVLFADDFDRQICLKLNIPTERYSCLINVDGVDMRHCSTFSNQMQRFRCEQDVNKFNQIEDECRKSLECHTKSFFDEHGMDLCYADMKRQQNQQTYVNPTFDMRRAFPDDDYEIYGWELPGAGILLLRGHQTNRLYTYNPENKLCNQLYK